MLARYLLAALEDGVAAADDEAARRSVAKIDWVLRGRARKRLEELLIDATLATGISDTSEPDASRHVLRAAALLLQDSRADLRDRDQVTRAYSKTTAPTLPKWPIATIAAAGLMLALTTTIGAASVMVATTPQPRAFERPTPPRPTGAYAIGGAPMHLPAIQQTLVELTKLTAHQPVSREPSALKAYPDVAAAWRDLIDAAPGLDLDDRSRDPAELRGRLQVLSDQLAGLGLGYYAAVERSPTNDVLIAVYRIEKVTFVRAADELVRVLDARRLAPVEGTRSVLGLKPEGITDPIVVIEQVDAHIDHELYPVLGGRPYQLSDDFWARTPRGRGATAAATRAIRRELDVALANDRTSDKSHERLRKLVLASVRHHEAQHGREQTQIPKYPEVLGKLVGPVGSPMAVRARNELSAYTSQIASDMWLPQAALWNLARHAFQASRRGSPESFAAVIVLEGLAKQLDIKSPGAAFHNGELDRDRLAELVAPLAAKSTIELRSAAARLWAELFDEPLVRLVDDRFGE